MKTFPLYRVDTIPEGFEDQYPWKAGDIVLILGEVKHMPGHCVVATKDGKVHFGYHTQNFVKLKKDEV